MRPVSVIVLAPQLPPYRRTVATLEDWQAIVGGYVEEVPLPACGMMVNEDGIAGDLDVNPLATRYAKRELARVGRVLLSADGWLLGTVFLIGHPDAHGEATDCPDVDLSGV